MTKRNKPPRGGKRPLLSSAPDPLMGGADLHRQKEDLPAHHFLGSASRSSQSLDFWKGVGTQMNDNITRPRTRSTNYAVIAAGIILVLTVAIFSNSLVGMPDNILNADDKTLAKLMEQDPDALAYALNEINIGE